MQAALELAKPSNSNSWKFLHFSKLCFVQTRFIQIANKLYHDEEVFGDGHVGLHQPSPDTPDQKQTCFKNFKADDGKPIL